MIPTVITLAAMAVCAGLWLVLWEDDPGGIL